VTIPVNEIFQTVQGEGSWTGTPAVFVRLQGCGVGCPWCDTKHTWVVDAQHAVAMSAMLDKPKDSPAWTDCTEDEIVAKVTAFEARHVVITGGEPCEHDLRALTKGLLAAERTVQIETSGTAEILADGGCWITVSPKVDMPGGKALLQAAVRRANEIKMPVGKRADIETLRTKVLTLCHNHPKPMIYLQPLSQSAKATELCVFEATRNGWRVSVQVHKYLGVR